MNTQHIKYIMFNEIKTINTDTIIPEFLTHKISQTTVNTLTKPAHKNHHNQIQTHADGNKTNTSSNSIYRMKSFTHLTQSHAYIIFQFIYHLTLTLFLTALYTLKAIEIRQQRCQPNSIFLETSKPRKVKFRHIKQLKHRINFTTLHNTNSNLYVKIKRLSLNKTSTRILSIQTPKSTQKLVCHIKGPDSPDLSNSQYTHANENNNLITNTNSEQAESVQNHTEVIKANKFKMWETLIAIVPEFSGADTVRRPNEVVRFLDISDYVYDSLTTDEERKIFSRLIRYRLTGEAFSRIIARRIDDYPALREILDKMYSIKYSLEELEQNIKETKQNKEESIRSYGCRIHEALGLYKINFDTKYNVHTIDNKHFEYMAIQAFKNGLNNQVLKEKVITHKADSLDDIIHETEVLEEMILQVTEPRKINIQKDFKGTQLDPHPKFYTRMHARNYTSTNTTILEPAVNRRIAPNKVSTLSSTQFQPRTKPYERYTQNLGIPSSNRTERYNRRSDARNNQYAQQINQFSSNATSHNIEQNDFRITNRMGSIPPRFNSLHVTPRRNDFHSRDTSNSTNNTQYTHRRNRQAQQQNTYHSCPQSQNRKSFVNIPPKYCTHCKVTKGHTFEECRNKFRHNWRNNSRNCNIVQHPRQNQNLNTNSNNRNEVPTRFTHTHSNVNYTPKVNTHTTNTLDYKQHPQVIIPSPATCTCSHINQLHIVKADTQSGLDSQQQTHVINSIQLNLGNKNTEITVSPSHETLNSKDNKSMVCSTQKTSKLNVVQIPEVNSTIKPTRDIRLASTTKKVRSSTLTHIISILIHCIIIIITLSLSQTREYMYRVLNETRRKYRMINTKLYVYEGKIELNRKINEFSRFPDTEDT